jgi:HAD superfamily hydrolase (TIGR01509 family)
LEIPVLEAIIFDFDGLILETETPIYQSWLELYQAYHQLLPWDEWQTSVGTLESPFDPYADLEQRVGMRLDWDQIDEHRRQREWERVVTEPVLPGVMDCLDQARQIGLKLGLASSSPHNWVDAHLHRLGLFDYFQAIQCSEDVSLTKPDPALYEQVIKILQVNRTTAFALEDSPAGALAAHRAGLFCVVVPNAMTRHMKFEVGDMFIDSLADYPLFDLIQEIEIRTRRDGNYA